MRHFLFKDFSFYSPGSFIYLPIELFYFYEKTLAFFYPPTDCV